MHSMNCTEEKAPGNSCAPGFGAFPLKKMNLVCATSIAFLRIAAMQLYRFVSCSAALVPGAVVATLALVVSVRAATYTTFDPAGSTATKVLNISAGVITGSYVDGSGASHGFVRAANGTITAFDPMGSLGTYAKSVNK